MFWWGRRGGGRFERYLGGGIDGFRRYRVGIEKISMLGCLEEWKFIIE